MQEKVSRKKLKSVMITRTAIKMLQSQDVVEKIISFQAKDAMKHFKTETIVDFPGFGRFMLCKVKAGKRLKKVEHTIEMMNKRREDGTDHTIKAFDLKLASFMKVRDYLKRILNED